MVVGAPACVFQVEWDRPWLDLWREPGQRVTQSVAAGTTLHEALNHEPPTPVRFVPQSALPPGEPYERYIFNSGQCPTREGLHDFFNGLCWLGFPETKKKLNQLQAAEIARAGASQLRGPVRDALTVFDENAAFLIAPQALWDALIEKDWKKLFIDLRPLWQQAQLVLFGHALLEKLVRPRKPITAHVYHAQPAINSIAHSLTALDAWIAQDLSADKLAGKPFVPLPVLGVPGWWPENENFSFYDDSLVFRTRKEPVSALGQHKQI